jgi:hypothetical protein
MFATLVPASEEGQFEILHVRMPPLRAPIVWRSSSSSLPPDASLRVRVCMRAGGAQGACERRRRGGHLLCPQPEGRGRRGPSAERGSRYVQAVVAGRRLFNVARSHRSLIRRCGVDHTAQAGRLPSPS